MLKTNQRDPLVYLEENHLQCGCAREKRAEGPGKRRGEGQAGDAGVGLLTGDLVQAFLGDMVVLVDPLPVALEVDLGGGVGAADELHWLVLHDVGVLWLQQKVREGLRWGRGEGVGQHVAVLQPCQGSERVGRCP